MRSSIFIPEMGGYGGGYGGGTAITSPSTSSMISTISFMKGGNQLGLTQASPNRTGLAITGLVKVYPSPPLPPSLLSHAKSTNKLRLTQASPSWSSWVKPNFS